MGSTKAELGIRCISYTLNQDSTTNLKVDLELFGELNWNHRGSNGVSLLKYGKTPMGEDT
ncbi:hypothetical protein TorRG33x02_328620 [Trema orientale]|uniref:Uncharacterized protein n=1 Tax=Trema orientale TaxID=63057 RepID=A0A2P5B9I3_TREOI|nr:hypothetical protein TorRG33x02_328620 [Trema orientale]